MPDMQQQGLRRSFAFSFAQKYCDAGLRLGLLAVLSRLLTPEDIGLFAVAITLVGVATILCDFGVKAYLIQAAEVSKDSLRSASTLVLCASWSLAVLLVLLVTKMPWIFDDPRLRDLGLFLAVRLTLYPFHMPALALLQREMQFKSLFVVTTLGTVAYAVLAVGMAVLGMGFMSLAWASLAEVICLVTGASLARRQSPLFLPSVRNWSQILSFGGAVTAVNALRDGAAAIPNLVIGQLVGFSAAGLFSRADSVVNIFNRVVTQAVTPVVLPMLTSRVRQGLDLKPAYLAKIDYMGGLSWPFFAFMALMADPLVAVLLGGGWEGVATIVRLLCLVGVVQPFNNMNLQFFIALGEVRRLVWIEAISIGAMVVSLSAFCLVSFTYAPLAIVLEKGLKFAFAYPLLKGKIKPASSELRSRLLRNAGVLAFSMAGPLLTLIVADNYAYRPLAVLIVAACVGGAGWLCGVFVLGHPIRGEMMRGWSRVRAVLQPAG